MIVVEEESCICHVYCDYEVPHHRRGRGGQVRRAAHPSLPSTSIITSAMASSQLAALADSGPRMMDRPAMDYFLIELVPTLRASAAVAHARAQRQEQEMVDAGLLPPAPPGKGPQSAVSRSSAALTSAVTKEKPEEEEDVVRKRLDAIGQHIGANIVERSVSPSSVTLYDCITVYLDYAGISLRLRIHWTRSSSYARTSGPYAGTSRSTTSVRTTEEYTCSKTTFSSPSLVSPRGRVVRMRPKGRNWCVHFSSPAT
jgi:hypothetical protein